MEIYTTIRLWSYGDVLKVMEIYTIRCARHMEI